MEQRTNLFGTVTGKDDRRGNSDHKNENHRLRDLPHEDERTDNGIDTRHNLHEVMGKGSVDGINVVGDTADNIAGCVGIKETYR